MRYKASDWNREVLLFTIRENNYSAILSVSYKQWSYQTCASQAE